MGFLDSRKLQVGSKEVICDFLGGGHTKDNIIAYFPSDQVMFGGCLIKSLGAGKGNLNDANVHAWSNTVGKLKARYSSAKIIIPGHGKVGDQALLDYTIEMFKKDAAVNIEALLLNCWTHSYEEDESGLNIYRPCVFKEFPKSRFRQQFTLAENEEASFLVLSPNDAHFFEKGKWYYKSEGKMLHIQNENGADQMKFEIIECTSDKMVVKQ